MTTNQTIDGVPRELLESPAKPVIEISLELLNTACNGFVQEQGHALNELREILSAHKVDKNVKSTGVILDSTHCGNSSNGDSNISIKTLAAQPQGEPVARLSWEQIVALVNEVLGCEAHKWPVQDVGHVMTGINFNSLARIIDRVQAEQPAPVAVVRMCDCNQGRLPCRCKP